MEKIRFFLKGGQGDYFLKPSGFPR